MSGKKKIGIFGIVLIMVAILGIGYAELSGIELNITGSAYADKKINFNVHFDNYSDEHEILIEDSASGAIISNTSTYNNTEYTTQASLGNNNVQATLVAAGYTDINQSITYSLKIVNEGNTDAEVSVIAQGTNLLGEQDDNFEVTYEYYIKGQNSEWIKSNESYVNLTEATGEALVKVIVTYIKESTEGPVTGDFAIKLEATPSV